VTIKKVIEMPMGIKKIAFFTVVFPSIAKYLGDFFGSLAGQTFKDFDLILINDGLEGIEKFKLKHRRLNIHEVALSGTPAKIREAGINLVVEKCYGAVIFGDADDYFAKNRVEKSVDLLENYDIVVNDFNLVDEEGKTLEEHYLSKRLKTGSTVNLKFIEDKNVLGFSNTAVRRSAFDKVIFNSELIAVDWFFFSYLLNMGASALFTDETVTSYRQHRLNMVGIGRYDDDTILRGIRTKLLQYEEMSKINPEYVQLREDIRAIIRKVEDDSSFKKSYLSKIKGNTVKDPLWWEAIKIAEDLK